MSVSFFSGAGRSQPPERHGMEQSNLTMAFLIAQVRRPSAPRRRGHVISWVAEVPGEDTLAEWWTGPLRHQRAPGWAPGLELASGSLRCEATWVQGGSDEDPAVQRER